MALDTLKTAPTTSLKNHLSILLTILSKFELQCVFSQNPFSKSSQNSMHILTKHTLTKLILTALIFSRLDIFSMNIPLTPKTSSSPTATTHMHGAHTHHIHTHKNPLFYKHLNTQSRNRELKGKKEALWNSPQIQQSERFLRVKSTLLYTRINASHFEGSIRESPKILIKTLSSNPDSKIYKTPYPHRYSR